MSNLNELLTQLETKLARIDEERNKAMEDVKAVRRTINLLAEPTSDTIQPRAETTLQHGNLRPENLGDCKNVSEALRKMALDNDYIITVAPAAKMIVAAEISKADPQRLASNLTNQLNNNDAWTHVGPGMYRLSQNSITTEQENTNEDENYEPITT